MQVYTNYEIGRRIFEQEQQGADRAQYGKEPVRDLAARLTGEFGSGFSKTNLKYMRRLYLAYPGRTPQIAPMASGQLPKVLFCDNGSEFTSQAMDLWTYRNGAKIDFSRSGKPTDNAFVESFNGTFRAVCLDTNWFMDLKEAKQLIKSWRREYNESRSYASLGDQTRSLCHINQ